MWKCHRPVSQTTRWLESLDFDEAMLLAEVIETILFKLACFGNSL